MTTYNKQTLATFFQTGDVPDGNDFANLIDSQINIVETSVQSMGGPLNTTELITARVSAGNAVFTGTVSANIFNANTFSINTLTVANLTTTTVSAGNTYATTLFQPVAIISATGITQATAALASAAICRVQGVNDGSTTGILLASAKPGWQQVIHNETAVSANLWPTVGGSINGGSTNAAFAMAANTGYRIAHLTNLTYSVK